MRVLYHSKREASLSLQEKWDNSGKQLGRFSQELTGVIYSLDLSEESVQEAIKNECNLIFTHHPVFFDPIKNLIEDQPLHDLAIECLERGICVYASHTNFDAVSGGVNDVLAEHLGLSNVDPLIPLALTNPMHAYSDGLGKIGHFTECPAKPLAHYLEKWKKTFHSPSMLVFGPTDIFVGCVACLGGSGADFIPDAIRRGADVYVTGDVTYHEAKDAVAQGLTVVDLGHYESEAPALHRARQWSKEIAPNITHCVVSHRADRLRQFL